MTEEWKGLTQYSLTDYQKATQQKEKLIAEIEGLESRRLRVMKSIMKAAGATGEITLKMLIQKLPEAVANKFAQTRREILKRIDEINLMNQKIKTLMERSSQSFQKSMAFVHSVDQQANAPYQSNGKFSQGKFQSRLVSVNA